VAYYATAYHIIPYRDRGSNVNYVVRRIAGVEMEEEKRKEGFAQ